MNLARWFLIALLAVPVADNLGCSRSFVGGAAVGAGGTGADYEYQNKKALDELESDFKAGRITKEEYLQRKDEIEKRSLVY
jgi:hypothetical protein